MAARPAQAPTAEQFEAYFHRADLDRDGKISGAEAVAFFQGANLPKQVLAQIWMHCDQKNTGFLGRAEFYNALRLVTVSQSGRGLTKDIVKAALEGPAAAKIPPPRINPIASPAPPLNPMPAARPVSNSMLPSSAPAGTLPAAPAQSVTSSGLHQFQNPGMNRPIPADLSGSFQATPASSSLQMQTASQGIPGGAVNVGSQIASPTVPSISNPITSGPPVSDQFGLGLPPSSAASANPGPQLTLAYSASLPPKPAGPVVSSSQPADKDLKALVVSGNGFSSGSFFGGDAFSVGQPKKDDFSFSTSTTSTASTTAFTTTGSQAPAKPVQLNNFTSMAPTTTGGLPPKGNQSLYTQNHQVSTRSISGPNFSAGTAAPGPNAAQPQWPKMSRSDVQKYGKVFVAVDKDRDGKITGEEARNLFLSWRLPREILKQVWDLSDQDNDSMLSLREFCIALYLMERYREGRPLPVVLPNSLLFDETLLQATGQPSPGVAWQGQPSPGYPYQRIPVASPVMPSTGNVMPTTGPAMPPLPTSKPPQQPQMPQSDGPTQPVSQKSVVPALEKHLVDQLSNEEQSSLYSKFKDASDADKKVQELEKEILDSKEKFEFYRTKMQELVLYKSRCDNRLNEIIERVSADKREVIELGKKYEEKCKQLGDVASKLTVEEATFRDIQDKKLELFNAIVKLNEGGSDDGLQDRVVKIQSDLEDLVQGLNDRCKKYGLRVKPTALVELPFGWQPGIQEGAADWNEEWDKFQDDGFMLVKELTVDVENIVAPPKSSPSSSSVQKASVVDSSPNAEDNEKEVSTPPSPGRQVIDGEPAAAETHGEDSSVRSLPSSPLKGGASESPSHRQLSPKFEMFDASPRIKDNHSDHDGESTISAGKYDDNLWGASFDTNDDTDSVWGFDNTSKDSEEGRNQQNFLFGSEDFGLNPIKTATPSTGSLFGRDSSPFFDSVPNSARTGSPGTASLFGKERNSFFADSVPGTPSFYSGFSPKYNEGLDQSYGGGGFSRFDSFNSQSGKNFTRFDSMSSSRDFDQGSFFSQNEKLARFDSIRSTKDNDHSRGFPSFDDSDPFGTGPFKSSSDSRTQTSDNWSSF